YVITRPDTPKPWVNHLTNDRYCAMVSHTGGGYSFVDDSGYNRITREQPGDEIITDRPGRYLYVRDDNTGNYWSAGWQPVQEKPSFWETRHGLGYTEVSSVNNDIQTTMRFFVPLEGLYEIWMIRIKNLSWKKKDLTLFTYVEWCLGNFYSDLMDRSFDVLFNKTKFDKNTILATKTRWIRPDRKDLAWDKHAFIYSNLGADSYDCNKSKFLGPFHYLKNPQVVEEGECSRSSGDGTDAVGVLSKKISLKPGQEILFDVVLGVVYEEGEIESVRRKFGDHKEVESQWQENQLYWQKYLEKIKVETPDEKFNISVNFWNKYQAWITPHWAEMDSYYISGGPTYGFRDECQHIMGILPQDAEFAEKKLVYLLEHQIIGGKVLHNFDVLSDQGSLTGHADDCQWLVMAIINHLEETGDLGFLKKVVKFHDSGEGTILEHLLKALDYTLSNISQHKLALHRTADWNDALAGGHLGKGESMMVSNQICWNIIRLLPILEKIDRKALVTKYQKKAAEIKVALNKYAWDGDWYIRATNDNGEVVGGKQKMEGKIFLNAQSWPIMSQVATQERGIKGMDAVREHLMTPYGPCLFLPSYTQLNGALGIISQFSPGTKENGTIFNHPVTWAVIAETILGRGDRAY
ncbi:glycosyl transferase family 36, partial [Patescibacteria group bacterium]|nr:glycosyl transferase family 36 [Patescibacteria group bacterium]